MIKPIIYSYLCRYPKLHAKILRLSRSKNNEKIFYLEHIAQGNIVFELGANRGYFTQLFSQITGNSGQVHAFEAVPPTYEILKNNCKNCTSQTLYLNNFAAGNHTGLVQMNMPVGDDGQASLKHHSSGAWKNSQIQQFDSQMIRLDDYVNEKKIPRLDFVKCDIEGAELLALQGFKSSLLRFKPALFIEVYSPWLEAFDYTAEDLFQFLKSVGYTKFFLVGEQITPVEETQLFENEPENVYCLP